MSRTSRSTTQKLPRSADSSGSSRRSARPRLEGRVRGRQSPHRGNSTGSSKWLRSSPSATARRRSSSGTRPRRRSPTPRHQHWDPTQAQRVHRAPRRAAPRCRATKSWDLNPFTTPWTSGRELRVNRRQARSEASLRLDGSPRGRQVVGIPDSRYGKSVEGRRPAPRRHRLLLRPGDQEPERDASQAPRRARFVLRRRGLASQPLQVPLRVRQVLYRGEEVAADKP